MEEIKVLTTNGIRNGYIYIYIDLGCIRVTLGTSDPGDN